MPSTPRPSSAALLQLFQKFRADRADNFSRSERPSKEYPCSKVRLISRSFSAPDDGVALVTTYHPFITLFTYNCVVGNEVFGIYINEPQTLNQFSAAANINQAALATLLNDTFFNPLTGGLYRVEATDDQWELHTPKGWRFINYSMRLWSTIIPNTSVHEARAGYRYRVRPVIRETATASVKFSVSKRAAAQPTHVETTREGSFEPDKAFSQGELSQ